MLDLQFGESDINVYIMDNHRPIHRKNDKSREIVNVFVDEEEVGYDEDVPSDVSDDEEGLSSGGSDDDDMDDLDDDDDDDDDSDSDAEDNKKAAAESDDEEFQDAAAENIDDIETTEVAQEENDDNDGDNEDDQDNEAADVINEKEDVMATDQTSDGGEEDEGNTSNEMEERPKLDEDDGDEEENVGKRRRRNLEHDPRRQKRMHRKKLEAYDDRPGYMSDTPTAINLLRLVGGRTVGGPPTDTIWQAILGMTDQYERRRLGLNPVHGASNDDVYTEHCEELKMKLKNHFLSERGQYKVSLNEESSSVEVLVPGAQTGHIDHARDYRFFLYRHWSLYEAMCFSPYICAKLGAWQTQGANRLQELLAKMGIPLDQCKQLYNFMNPSLRNHFALQLKGNATLPSEYGLENPQVTHESFCRYNSFKKPVAASDVVYAASALVESCKNASNDVEETQNETFVNAFQEAYDCLGMQREEKLDKGLQMAINLQKMIVRKASVLLEDYLAIHDHRDMYWVQVTSSMSDNTDVEAAALRRAQASLHTEETEFDAPFSRPMVLLRLGQFIMDVKLNTKKATNGWTEKKIRPLVVVGESFRGKCIVVGISPLDSVLGKAAVAALDEDQDLRKPQKYLADLKKHRHDLDALCNFSVHFKLAARELAKNGTNVRYPGVYDSAGRGVINGGKYTSLIMYLYLYLLIYNLY